MPISGHKIASVFQRYRIVDDADVRAALERTEAAGKRAGRAPWSSTTARRDKPGGRRGLGPGGRPPASPAGREALTALPDWRDDRRTMAQTEGYNDKRLVTRALKLEYDYVAQTGRLYQPAACHTDMTGVIDLFKHIHPDVERIETFADGKPDNLCTLNNGKWTAGR
jgi:hypothetical protein